MRNGYFRLVSDSDGYGIALYQPKDGGDFIQMGELMDYLDGLGVSYDRKRIEMQLMEDVDSVCHIGGGPCPDYPESYQLKIDEDGMSAFVRFIPPTSTGKRMTFNDFQKDLHYKGITFGLQMEILQSHFNTEGRYCQRPWYY